MKAIFLANEVNKLKEVYSGTASNRLQEMGIDISKMYGKDNLNSKDLSETEIIFSTWNMPVLSKDTIRDRFPALRAVFYAGGTVKYFAKPFLELGINVYSASLANAKAVADFTTAQILLANKGFFQSNYLYKHRLFRKAKTIALNHYGNYNARIGIIGAGNIGKLVIENLKPFDVEIYICDPAISITHAKELGCKKAEMSDIFECCDVISNHLPNIPATMQILNFSLFSKMKDYSTFINTGRGRQVVETDLIRALKKNKTICAVLDVTNREPLLPTSRLLLMKNVFITPHIAGSTNMEQLRMSNCMVDAYTDFINNAVSPYSVSLDMLAKMT